MSTLLILLANVLSIITNADICISRDPEGTSNVGLLGNYQEKTDSNGDTYYEKDQALCDTEPEYLYLRNDQWIVSPVLNGATSYIRCPTANLATPDLCPAGTWNNGAMSPDPQLQVTNTACPEEDSTPDLKCEYILLQDTGNEENGNPHDGLYQRNGANLYGKDENYLLYSKQYQRWIISNEDARETCDAVRYFISSDETIDGLTVGRENVEFDMSHPSQEGDYSCKKPKISCLDSRPSDEILNDALCNYPCVEPPSLSCNYIQIDRSGGNYLYDGIYNKIDDNLYRYEHDDDNIYFFQYHIQGEYYIISTTDDRNLCGNNGPSAYLRSLTDSDIGTLEHGDSIVPELDWPVGVEFTITCLESTASPTVGPTASPVPAAPDGLCVAAASNVFIRGVRLTDIAGTYALMDEVVNSSPAYELIGCDGKPSAYISMEPDPRYPYYFLSRNLNDPYPSGPWVTYCTNTAAINGDISKCVWSNGNRFEVTAGGGCPCGQTLGSNANAIPRIEPELPDAVVEVPSTDTKPVTIWSQFVDVLHQETISIALVCVLVMMMVWTIVMCADLFGCKRSNQNYSAVKVVDDI